MGNRYKHLGDYIHKVENRNRDLKVSKLVGLSMTKEFRVSTSNIVGTDMSVYKVVNKWQFSCDFMSVIRVHKFPVVLKTDDDPVLVSPAYTVFEVNDENELNPEYLMMWFRRSEFDRYADFKCDSAIRGGFDWDALCDCMLPIPSIEKQREIVREYNTIQNRINLNNQLIAKLEETAQTIYKQWFVEGIDFENLPKGWNTGKLADLIEIKYGKSYSHLEEGEIPLYGSGGLMSKVNKPLYTKPSVLIPRKGTLSNIMFIKHPFWCVDTMFYSIFKNEINGYYSYYILKQLDFDALNQGSAVPSMTTAFLNDIDVVLPNKDILKNFNEVLHKTISHKENIERENQKLEELKELLLGRMMRN